MQTQEEIVDVLLANNIWEENEALVMVIPPSEHGCPDCVLAKQELEVLQQFET
jgi:hypothetical protein